MTVSTLLKYSDNSLYHLRQYLLTHGFVQSVFIYGFRMILRINSDFIILPIPAAARSKA
jgi:hypothetical protein